MEEVVVGLVRGKHEMPVTDYIFDDGIENPSDFEHMDEVVQNFIDTKIGVSIRISGPLNSADYTDIDTYMGKKNLTVYVSGLTAATAAVIRCCAYCGVGLELMHYNPVTGDYVPQTIFHFHL